jgi:histone acetyltransferase 1
LYKISLEDESFHEQNFYMQSLLPFFIDGASVIEPSPFWQYFIIYDEETSDLLAYATVYEAHISAVKFRAKISQVLVLPPYQKQGLGSQIYRGIYDYYRLKEDNCFQIIVEDSAEDF